MNLTPSQRAHLFALGDVEKQRATRYTAMTLKYPTLRSLRGRGLIIKSQFGYSLTQEGLSLYAELRPQYERKS